MPPSKRLPATTEDATILAICEGRFRFASAAQATALMDRVGRTFMIAKMQDMLTADSPPTLRLWIRGFALTDEERAQGFRGHYARLSVEKAEGEKFTVRAEKIPTPLPQHPQKERPNELLPKNRTSV